MWQCIPKGDHMVAGIKPGNIPWWWWEWRRTASTDPGVDSWRWGPGWLQNINCALALGVRTGLAVGARLATEHRLRPGVGSPGGVGVGCPGGYRT
jgi:hypothetical protein